jgi:transcriptional regulator with XRE-family HTH domain
MGMALGSHVRRFRERRGWTLEHLCELSGVAVGTISALENRDSVRSQYVDALAQAFGVDASQLMTGRDPEALKVTGVQGAQVLSHPRVKTPPLLTLEGVQSVETLPDVFVIEMPDNSMAPKAPRGCQATMQPSNHPEFGNAALVRTGSGRVFFRECRLNADGSWTAYALNPAFPSLHSTEHGLAVVAVCRHVAVPWSSAPSMTT